VPDPSSFVCCAVLWLSDPFFYINGSRNWGNPKFFYCKGVYPNPVAVVGLKICTPLGVRRIVPTPKILAASLIRYEEDATISD